MACILPFEDPQENATVPQAYAVLVEAHLNFETQAIIGVFRVWRSRAAYQSGKQPMQTIPVPLDPNEGGKEFFAQYGIDGAGCALGPRLRDWCIHRSKELAAAVPSEQTANDPSDV